MIIALLQYERKSHGGIVVAEERKLVIRGPISLTLLPNGTLVSALVLAPDKAFGRN